MGCSLPVPQLVIAGFWPSTVSCCISKQNRQIWPKTVAAPGSDQLVTWWCLGKEMVQIGHKRNDLELHRASLNISIWLFIILYWNHGTLNISPLKTQNRDTPTKPTKKTAYHFLAWRKLGFQFPSFSHRIWWIIMHSAKLSDRSPPVGYPKWWFFGSGKCPPKSPLIMNYSNLPIIWTPEDKIESFGMEGFNDSWRWENLWMKICGFFQSPRMVVPIPCLDYRSWTPPTKKSHRGQPWRNSRLTLIGKRGHMKNGRYRRSGKGHTK